MNILNIHLNQVGQESGRDEMRIQRKSTLGTPKNLLVAASEVFAEKGYRDATIVEICERAKANIAAVNYHFGNKKTLYKEAWRHCFSESIKAHPPNGGVSDHAPAEERLRGRVSALLHRVADQNNREFRFVQKELANPTGLLSDVMREEIRPLHQKMETLVRELLGPQASNMQVRFCTISIVSQCINPMVAMNKERERQKGEETPPGIDDIGAYSNHVVKFSLAGIRAIRDDLERPGRRSRRGGNALKQE